MKKWNFTAILLAAILTASCGTSDQTDDTTAVGADTTTKTSGYDYPDVNLDGQTIKILTADEYWGKNVDIAVEEQSGEPLSDAIYNRNTAVEEALNCKIEDTNYEISGHLPNMITPIQKEIAAGDSTHDVMYIPANNILAFTEEGYFTDLAGYDELQLDQPWWNSTFNDVLTFGGATWGAAGDAMLMPYDGMWMIFFNENIIEDNNMELPYDLVREGKWTLDELYKYATSLANLNSDESFAWKDGGSSVYGLASHWAAPDYLLFSAGNDYTTKDGDKLTFTADTERFYNTVEKMTKLFGEAGTHFAASTDDFSADDGGYVYVFMNNRAAFLTAELKTANNIRDMESAFGVVPFPKYDEKQENYRTAVSSGTLVMTIPATSKTPETAALVMDALAYESSQLVVPTYFDVIVEQKGLRNEDSIEMLEIVKQTCGVDMGTVGGFISDLLITIRNKTRAGDASVASDIAAAKSAAETKMAEFLELMGIE
ncbi:MAG: extracellular solute-binding protein [Clostridia bacterium]|nr:extracellular solute-binding protein [Clostridia bacterium]